jgi:hypothetical protein
VEDVEAAIDSLPKLGFSVIRSKSKRETIVKITRVAKEVAWRHRNGSLDTKYTYTEFIRRVNALDSSKGEPPTLPEHQNPSPMIVDISDVRGGGGTTTAAAAPPTSTTPVSRSLNMPKGSTPPPDDDADNSNVKSNKKDSQLYDKDAVSSEGDTASQLEAKSAKLLKQMCQERCLKMTGSKRDLVARLLQPRKPEILITRQRLGGYVPKVPSCNAAILVALLLHNHSPGTSTQTSPDGSGLTKEQLLLYAEECGLSKDPMGGVGGYYDGWSGMKQLVSGDPGLVTQVKKKFLLTSRPYGSAGIDIAKALHLLAHREEHQLCQCQQHIDTLTGR